MRLESSVCLEECGGGALYCTPTPAFCFGAQKKSLWPGGEDESTTHSCIPQNGISPDAFRPTTIHKKDDVETPYRRQILSCVLAFSPRLCDVLGRVEGEASVPRVRRLTVEMPYRRQTLSHVLAFAPVLCDVRTIGRVERRRGERSASDVTPSMLFRQRV